jgi:hypothetical protein
MEMMRKLVCFFNGSLGPQSFKGIKPLEAKHGHAGSEKHPT